VKEKHKCVKCKEACITGLYNTMLHENSSRNAKARSVLNVFTQSYLPPTRFYSTNSARIKHKVLSLTYKSLKTGETFLLLTYLNFRRLFEAGPNTVPTLGIRMDQNILDSDIKLNSIAINSTPYSPPL